MHQVDRHAYSIHNLLGEAVISKRLLWQGHPCTPARASDIFACFYFNPDFIQAKLDRYSFKLSPLYPDGSSVASGLHQPHPDRQLQSSQPASELVAPSMDLDF